MEAIVEVRNNYGVDTLYPVNQNAKLIAQLAGTKTLTRQSIEIAKQLGYSFTVHHHTVSV